MMRFALDKELTVQTKCGFLLVFMLVFVCILCYIHIFFSLNHLNYYLGCGLHLQIRSCRIQSTFSCVFFSLSRSFMRLLGETVEICQVDTGNGVDLFRPIYLGCYATMARH